VTEFVKNKNQGVKENLRIKAAELKNSNTGKIILNALGSNARAPGTLNASAIAEIESLLKEGTCPATYGNQAVLAALRTPAGNDPELNNLRRRLASVCSNSKKGNVTVFGGKSGSKNNGSGTKNPSRLPPNEPQPKNTSSFNKAIAAARLKGLNLPTNVPQNYKNKIAAAKKENIPEIGKLVKEAVQLWKESGLKTLELPTTPTIGNLKSYIIYLKKQILMKNHKEVPLAFFNTLNVNAANVNARIKLVEQIVALKPNTKFTNFSMNILKSQLAQLTKEQNALLAKQPAKLPKLPPLDPKNGPAPGANQIPGAIQLSKLSVPTLQGKRTRLTAEIEEIRKRARLANEMKPTNNGQRKIRNNSIAQSAKNVKRIPEIEAELARIEAELRAQGAEEVTDEEIIQASLNPKASTNIIVGPQIVQSYRSIENRVGMPQRRSTIGVIQRLGKTLGKAKYASKQAFVNVLAREAEIEPKVAGRFAKWLGYNLYAKKPEESEEPLEVNELRENKRTARQKATNVFINAARVAQEMKKKREAQAELPPELNNSGQNLESNVVRFLSSKLQRAPNTKDAVYALVNKKFPGKSNITKPIVNVYLAEKFPNVHAPEQVAKNMKSKRPPPKKPKPLGPGFTKNQPARFTQPSLAMFHELQRRFQQLEQVNATLKELQNLRKNLNINLPAKTGELTQMKAGVNARIAEKRKPRQGRIGNIGFLPPGATATGLKKKRGKGQMEE